MGVRRDTSASPISFPIKKKKEETEQISIPLELESGKRKHELNQVSEKGGKKNK